VALRKAFDDAVQAYVDFKCCHKGFDRQVAILRNKLRYGIFKASIPEVTSATNDIWGRRSGVLAKNTPTLNFRGRRL